MALSAFKSNLNICRDKETEKTNERGHVTNP